MAAPTHIGPQVVHSTLGTTFTGVLHPKSTSEARIHQYRGIKYASIPARFRQSILFTTYGPHTDASKYGPICPQIRASETVENLLFNSPSDDLAPVLEPQQDEFECLNLNITCPDSAPGPPQLPVMVWIHGGGDRGSGSSWAYDGGAVVRKGVELGRPIILVTINYRIGLFGFAANPAIRDDNEIAGDKGTGNYGLHDQRQALFWIRNYISAFGGSSSSVTLFGSSTGAADIISHLLSSYNATTPLFHRAILQSPTIDPCPPNVYASGSMMSRLLCHIDASISNDVSELRKISAEDLVNLCPCWFTRVTDDGDWFKNGWKSWFGVDGVNGKQRKRSRSRKSERSRSRTHSTHRSRLRTPSRTPSDLQPIIIGDSSPLSRRTTRITEATLMSMWTSTLLTRRLKAVCQSLVKASRLLRAYELDPSQTYGEDDEDIFEIEARVRELVHDARVGWPTECVAEAALHDRGGIGVWRYVFDEEGVEDVRSFFDCAKVEPVPFTTGVSSGPRSYESDEFAGTFSEEEISSSSEDSFDDGGNNWGDPAFDSYEDEVWGTSSFTCSPYQLVRDALQSRWIAFSYGETPWNEDSVYVFGPEGETGERSRTIFEGRRRREVWNEIFASLGMSLVWKVGVELERGPTGVGMGIRVFGSVKA